MFNKCDENKIKKNTMSSTRWLLKLPYYHIIIYIIKMLVIKNNAFGIKNLLNDWETHRLIDII